MHEITSQVGLPPTGNGNKDRKLIDWVLKKVEELQAYVGISCDGFEEKIIPTEVSQSGMLPIGILVCVECVKLDFK